ncbi:MAG: DinB family protein [Acidimicrobiaceae bacterium]|nr:DinB family protein [Acidimicrobiaceae bacterium]
MTPEIEHLLRSLDKARKGALKKLDGLSEEEARRSTVDSGTNLAGLIQHLTFVESMWFEQVVGGRSSPHGIRSMQVDPSVTLPQLRAAYKASWAVSDEIIKGLGDGDAPVEHNGKKHDLRWAIDAVLGETKQHTGHADIIREQIDGRTGR